MDFVKGLEQARLGLSPHVRIHEQLEAVVRTIRADLLGRSLARDAILKQIRPTAVELRLIEAMKPRPIDLAWYNANKMLATQLGETIAGLTKPFAEVSKQLTSQCALWQKSIQDTLCFAGKLDVLAPSIQKALMVQGAASEQLVQVLKRSPLLNIRQDLASSLFVPQGVFAEFARKTIQLTGTAPSDTVAKTLRCSLGLAESQLLESVGLLAELVEGAVAEKEGSLILPKADLVVPFVQQGEMLASGAALEEDDLSAAVANSDAARLCDLARRVLQLVPACNEAARIALSHEIFKPTNRCIESCARLPWTLADDKSTLGDVVDYLFWMLYEGAGDDKLRFHVDGNGPLTSDECNAVFWVKFLRNKWLRHDPDHGKESKIDKSWKDVGEALASLGLKHLPVTEQDFRFIQRRLLEEAERFLKLLLGRLTGRSTEEN
jgi:hypothetical protein